MDKILVYIADNQDLTRFGIISTLSTYFNKQAEFRSFSAKSELISALSIDKPQLLIIDYDLLDFENISEFGSIINLSPSSGILVITDNQNTEDISAVLNLGISVYVLKNCQEAELIEAVNAALTNRKYFSNTVLDLIIGFRNKPKPKPDQTRLTVAETEIVRLITQGLTTKEIASQKCLSFHTVITHRKNIFRKLNINSTSELMLYAMRNGIIDSLEYYI